MFCFHSNKQLQGGAVVTLDDIWSKWPAQTEGVMGGAVIPLQLHTTSALYKVKLQHKNNEV